MDHLYYYLIGIKNYSTEKAEKAIYLLGINEQLPEDIEKDINEYCNLWNAANPNTLFDEVEL